MEGAESDPGPRRKRRVAVLESGSSGSESDVNVMPRRRERPTHLFDDSDTDSDSSVDLIAKKRKSRPVLISESDDNSSSDSDVFRKRRGASRIPSDDDSYASDWSTNSTKAGSSSKKVPSINDSSSDSDGQSDKCPICLVTFKTQEVGSPEACDHSFCVECIQEWSKNVNTCPVDRQPFNLILVRSHYNGKIIRQVPVEPLNQPNEVNEVVEDPTYCEICGNCDREDRMLLCDGCDLGYHLECLTPPLHQVPVGIWYCSDCGPDDVNQDVTIYVQEVEMLLNDAEDLDRPSGPRRRNSIRLVPRTRQSERVRATIMTNRTQNRNQRNQIEEQIQVVVSQNIGPSTSGRRKKKKKRSKRRKPKIKISYAIDDETGQTIVIETKTRKRKRRKKRRPRLAAVPKTVKKRLAVQLGMCAPRAAGQTLPDVRVSMESHNIGFQRSQAGIPALHLFGTRDGLDFLSGSDADNEGEGPGLLRRRRPNLSDAAIFRRAANRKSVLLSTSPPASTSDVLSSILDSQEKFHSKNAVLSVRKDGSVAVDTKRKPVAMNNNNDRVNLNDTSNVRIRHAPSSNSPEPSPGSPTMSNSAEYRNSINTVTSNTVTTSNNAVITSSGGGESPMEPTQNYSINTLSCSNDVEQNKKIDVNSPKSDSELDIYSDIETVSTSKAGGSKGPSPVPEAPLIIQSDDEANNSDVDLVIDTEKVEDKTTEEERESKEEDVTSTTNVGRTSEEPVEKSYDEEDADADSEDGCPNFSIYSAESIKFAKTTDLELLNQEANVGSSLDVTKLAEEEKEKPPEDLEPESEHEPEPEPEPASDGESPPTPEPPVKLVREKLSDPTALYSDSDDEVARVDAEKPFGIGDIRSMTEDISEEERSYTPCLDERQPFREGLDGLDTEAISDEEKNDFDEAQELKTASDGGDALEINAKECELDFTKPEEYEEGEIVDKLKKIEEAKKTENNNNVEQNEAAEVEKETTAKESPSFKKISKSNKDRNYRDKEKDGSKSPSKEREHNKKKERKREKRKEIERYNVRTVVAEKPRRMKDKFGRDARRRSLTRSSRSTSPAYRSASRGRRSYSREKTRKRRGRSHSPSRSRKRSRSRNRRRSLSRSRTKRRRSRERSKNRKKNRSLSRHRSRSLSPRRRRDWERRSRGWSPSPSRSRSRLTPSWTPPRIMEKQPVKPHNLTVILTNDSNKKKKDKKRSEKKKKESEKQKKRKRDKTPPPSKEVFASGDNILVSVSFNDEREREATVKRKRDDDITTKRTRKEKERLQRSAKVKRKKTHDLSGIKPVAIIDLDRSPFKEITPSPKDIIVLSDSENGETQEDVVCDSSQQPDYPTGPKTPPEPQIKFSLNAKAPQLRAINNPLHEPDDMDGEMDPQEELEARLNDTLHKGPNTPPEPPNSPPSSPDAYDPFDPTKSRSPTPDNTSNVQSCLAQSTENNLNETSDLLEKSAGQLVKTPDVSHTPPVVADIQPADSQSNASTNTPDINTKQTPERNIGVVINQVVQSQPSIFPMSSNKSGAQTTAYSSAPLVSSTPLSTNLAAARINVLNSTILAPSAVMSSIPQRIVLPTTTKSSPIKVSPTKPPIKSTPIKPMPNKSISKASKAASRKSNSRINNDVNDSTLEIDSPYSPGPSDYEDLFEPPSETIHPSKPSKSKVSSNKGNSGKGQGTFDTLFGSSPIHKMNKSKSDKKKKVTGKGTKLVGVKIDEDSLKILDDLPNSAVEMQVKDKFLKKLNRQERVVEEVKLVLKPHYNKKHINKEEYKDILRRSVPKICHNKSGEINPTKIHHLIEAYVKKLRHSKKVTSSSSVNPLK